MIITEAAWSYNDGEAGAFIAGGPLAASGWREGEGLFETLLVLRGVAIDLAAHLRRLQASAPAFSVTLDPDMRIAEAVNSLCARDSHRERARLRIHVQASPIPAERQARVALELSPCPPPCDPSPVSLAALPDPRPPSMRVHKASDRSWNLEDLARAQALGHSDALWIDEAGDAWESTSAALVWWDCAGALHLADAPGHALPSVTRARLRRGLEAEGLVSTPQPLPINGLDRIAGAALASSVRLLRPVARIDSRVLPNGSEFFARLKRILWKETLLCGSSVDASSVG